MIDEFRGDYGWLSNLVGSCITPKGTWCKTVEHAFQASKTLVPSERQMILACETPGQAKRLGRKVTLRLGWDAVKDRVMLTLVRSKLSNPALAAMLLSTGWEPLIEGNYWHDNYWGSCKCAKCGDNGQNKLGKILMQVRTELREKRNG